MLAPARYGAVCVQRLVIGGNGLRLVRSGRDMRVDFFRGLALWWIFIDHTPDNWLNQFSLRNFALCDSAEVFVLLAGYGAGLAYGRSMDRNGYVYAAADTLKRAWTLYIAHIFLFVVFAAQVSYSATMLDRADYLDEVHLDVLGEEPYRAMMQALLLHFQPAYLDILPMYVALLVLFALVMPLLRWPHVLACASFTLYAAARLAGLKPALDDRGWMVFQSVDVAALVHVGGDHGLCACRPTNPPGPDHGRYPRGAGPLSSASSCSSWCGLIRRLPLISRNTLRVC